MFWHYSSVFSHVNCGPAVAEPTITGNQLAYKFEKQRKCAGVKKEVKIHIKKIGSYSIITFKSTKLHSLIHLLLCLRCCMLLVFTSRLIWTEHGLKWSFYVCMVSYHYSLMLKSLGSMLLVACQQQYLLALWLTKLLESIVLQRHEEDCSTGAVLQCGV